MHLKAIDRIVLFLILFSGCSSATKNPGDLKSPAGYVAPQATQLTNVGSNTSPVVSADGLKIMFLSGGRPQHAQSQIYEMDFATRTQRRITYQAGDIYDVAYHTDRNKIFYSSNTDESKENPVVIKNLKSQLSTGASPATVEKSILGLSLPATEIYMSSFAGDDIQRLTQREGFDGDIALRPKNPEFYFINFKDNKARVQVFNLNSQALWAIGSSQEAIANMDFSPDGKSLVWVQKNSDVVELMIADARMLKAHRLLDKSAIYLNPHWSPDGNEIVFSSNLDDTKNFEIYAIKADSSCLRRLTYNASFDSHPTFLPDQKKLVFVSDRTGAQQIFTMSYLPPPCP